MRIVEQFKIKCQPETKSGKQTIAYATLHPAALSGIDPGTLVSITNTRNGKRVFCIVKTDIELCRNQISIDSVLQKKLKLEKQKDNKGIILAIVSQPMPYYAIYWMNHPNVRARFPLLVGTAIVVGLLAISILLIGF